MTFDRMLPDVLTVVTVGEDVVDGRLVDVETVVAEGIPGRYVPRNPADVVYNAAGEIVVEADVLTRYPLELGQAVKIGGRRHLVSGVPSARRRAGPAVHHYSAPVRSG